RGLDLVEEPLDAQPEEPAIEGDVHPQSEMELVVVRPGSLEHAVVEDGHELAVDDLQGGEGAALHEEGELRIDIGRSEGNGGQADGELAVHVPGDGPVH